MKKWEKVKIYFRNYLIGVLYLVLVYTMAWIVPLENIFLLSISFFNSFLASYIILKSRENAIFQLKINRLNWLKNQILSGKADPKDIDSMLTECGF